MLQDRGWYSTNEFPRAAAFALLEKYKQKYDARIEPVPSGNYVVKYRRFTDEQKRR